MLVFDDKRDGPVIIDNVNEIKNLVVDEDAFQKTLVSIKWLEVI